MIAEIQPQAAYSLYVHRFKSKFNLFDCTILTIQSHMKGIEDILRICFIPAIIGESSISECLRHSISLSMYDLD